jgi:hypothetical protein
MLPSSEYDSQLYLYALANPRLFAQETDAITRFVFQALQVSPSANRTFSLSADSGWTSYTAADELWSRRAAAVLPSKANAISAAEGLLTRLEKQCSDANKDWPKALQGMALFPPVVNLRRAEVFAVAREDGTAFDHWLYRAEPQLVLDGGGKTKASVYGAQVEVRIGNMGQPISFRSRWQPLSGERKFTTLSPYQPPADAGTDAQPVTNYLLEGDGIPQYYLAPYHVTYDGHDVNMSSASPFSLTVDVARINQDQEKTTLAALADGGSGDYVYNWASYSLNRLDQGIRELGSGSEVQADVPGGRATASVLDIDNGAYVVLINVKDRQTGAFKHQQQQVFSSLITDDTQVIA